MKLLSSRALYALVLLSSLASSPVWSDPMSALQLLRISGCGGVMPSIAPLQHNGQLDRAAAAWASGESVATATDRSGYPAQRTVALRLSGPDDAILLSLRRSRCRPLADQLLRDVGLFRRGAQTWLVLAAPHAGSVATSLAAVPPQWTTLRPHPQAQALAPEAAVPNPDEPPPRTFGYATAPRPSQSGTQAARVLQRVNEVRATGTTCGTKSMAPAPPLHPSATLDEVAAEHASDMARHDYFEHVDLSGRSPADRLRALGYHERLVGENIAYGPQTADEVVSGWLHSPGHCENIMDPRFAEMGIAFAPGQVSRRGLYWVQVLAEPSA